MTGSVALSSNKLDALIAKAVDIHTLPVVVFEAERLMRDPRTSAQQVADLIARDPALASRILKLVNSSYYGFQKRIGNLTQAIVILGFQTVKNLMLTVSVIESFRGDPGDAFDYSRFWSHSVACAIAAGELARLAETPHGDEAYIAGLLHDIGKLLVAQHFPSTSREIHQKVASGLAELEAERLVIGRDHSDVGSMLAQSWSLPPSLCEAIRDHHHPPRRGPGSIADVLHLGDLLVSAVGIRGNPSPLPPVSAGLSDRLGYDSRTLAQWISRIVERLEQAQDFFEVVGAGPLQFE